MRTAVNLLLWSIVGILVLIAAVRSQELVRTGLRDGGIDFLKLLPRIAIGVVGSGYLAEVLPQHVINAWLGPSSGMTGVALATVAGAFTPGGPVVGFAIAATALKGGAGAPQVIAYSVAWALYAIHRLFMWEIPVMPAHVVWLRAIVSLPLPFLAAAGAMLLGHP